MASILDRRASGILLHPTSLDGPHGIGDLGVPARAFVDFLACAGQRWWQMLPIAPPAICECPYTALSAFAGNPLLISLEDLVAEGLLPRREVARLPRLPSGRLDRNAAWSRKRSLLERALGAFGAFAASGPGPDLAEAEHGWIEDYALYAALREAHGGQPWDRWPPPLRRREARALAIARGRLSREIAFHRFVQAVFDRQWRALRAHAASRGVALLGDVPIFVAHDSADVWRHPELFQLDRKTGRPRFVAGVPPDYFAEDGQLWGNPLYDWDAHAASGYAWWIDRFRATFARFDAVRLDHFIGFARYWAVPGRAKTARRGTWREGPGAALFDALTAALGTGAPIVAEDLGVVTPEVAALRDRFGFPGMRVLQFGFGPVRGENSHQPHTYERRCVVYTGTHDNDTTRGWFEASAAATRANVRAYLGGLEREGIVWGLIRLAQLSPANLAIVPLQDLLGLGSGARMNVPGVAEGNWLWRCPAGALTGARGRRIAARLGTLSALYGRRAVHAGLLGTGS